MRIGILGLGTITSALVESIAGDGHAITVSRRSAANADRLTARFTNVEAADNQAVLDESDVVFIGLMADAADAILAPLRFREGQTVISLMADASFAHTEAAIAPARMAARMIPFPPIAAGGSPILTFGDDALVHALFGARNAIFPLANEAELAAYLCAQAVLSPATSLVASAAAWLGPHVSDQETGEAFLRTLVGSSLLGTPCHALLRALDTPGGYNQRLRDHMLASGMDKAVRSGLDDLRGPPDEET
ncbi:NAD(P)-binding domain-containing protein [Acuticoccus sp. M5D2P5]|uniref:NAD(P)-binding domain-containing protein n=1 Tax=Acuticoccus kalidii TaxID=2910977 RepID=UPI001F40BB29|nr:NAD(P)-binding domain-containing protein [Acuticoccus kalidii]